jgi:hypothetical protein
MSIEFSWLNDPLAGDKQGAWVANSLTLNNP